MQSLRDSTPGSPTCCFGSCNLVMLQYMGTHTQQPISLHLHNRHGIKHLYDRDVWRINKPLFYTGEINSVPASGNKALNYI